VQIHTPSGRWRLGLGLTLLTVFLWGMLPIALKITLEQMDGYSIIWYRFLTSAVLLGSWLWFRGKLPRLRGRTRSVYILLVLVTLGLGTNYLFYILGLDRISAGSAQVVIQLAPALAMLGALFFFRERFRRLQWIGFFLLVSGLILFFHDRLGEIFLGRGKESTGVLLVVAAALTWAVFTLAQKQLLQQFSSSGVLLVVYLGSVLLILPTASPGSLKHLDLLHLSMLVFCALNTLVAYGSFSEALEHWEATRVSAVLSLTPLATLAMAWAGSRLWPGLVVGELISPLALCGALVVVAGSAAIALGGRS
jgi:drug/metabolite transporter (DMT)-like permease